MESDPLTPANTATSRGTPGPIAQGRGTVAAGLLAASATVLALGCVDTTGPPFPLIEATDFAPALGIDLTQMTRTRGGIYLLDLAKGTGTELQIDHRVVVSYVLFLADGTLVEEQESMSFRMSCRQVVPGLEAGIKGMRVGGRRLIVVPGRLGYGLSPPPGTAVPIGAVLVYEVEAESSRLVVDIPCPGSRP